MTVTALLSGSDVLTRILLFPSDANFIKCHTDELIGFAFALKLPIIMSAQVFDTLSVAGLLTKVRRVVKHRYASSITAQGPQQ